MAGDLKMKCLSPLVSQKEERKLIFERARKKRGGGARKVGHMKSSCGGFDVSCLSSTHGLDGREAEKVSEAGQ